MDIQPKPKKDIIIPIRATKRDRDLIRGMAQQAGLTVSAFMLARAWGEDTSAPAAVSRASDKPSLDSLLASGLISRGMPGEPIRITAEGSSKTVAKRSFNPSRRSWYESEGTEVEWAEIAHDRQTGQWFLVLNGQGTEYESREACLGMLESVR